MSEGEPDSMPLNEQHVRDFLAWYRVQVSNQLTRIDVAFNVEWWWNALRSLTLGELRNGIRSYMRFDSKLALSPVEFWGLCKGTQDQRAIEQFRRMREAVRKAPKKAKGAPA